MRGHFFGNPVKRRQLLLVIGDALIVTLAFLIGHAIRALNDGRPLVSIFGRLAIGWFVVVVAAHLVSFFVCNLYNADFRFTKGRGSVAVTFAVLLAVVWSGTILFFAVGRPAIGRVIFAIHIPLVIVGATALRAILLPRFRERRARMRVALLGIDSSTPELVHDIERLGGFDIAARIREVDGRGPQSEDGVLLCAPDELDALICEQRIDVVIYSVVGGLTEAMLASAVALRIRGVDVRDAPSVCGWCEARIPTNSVDARWILSRIETRVSRSFVRNTEQFIEQGAALLLCALFAPLALFIALAIIIESKGPVFFKQERLGLNKKPFMLLKFRTMRPDAETHSGPVWATARDPRITRVGEFLRRTGLDEIPQIVNIIRGEMSFIGNRPIRKHFADLLAAKIPHYDLRFAIKPGVTGWAQVRHDYAGTMEGQRRKFEFELYYLTSASIVVDCYILIKTAQKLLHRKVGDASMAESPQQVQHGDATAT